MPSCLWNPFATNLAFYLSTMPSSFLLILNIDLHPSTFWEEKDGTKDQVPISWRAFNSSCVANLEWAYFEACKYVVGT